PYWARGLYNIDYDNLENWKRSETLSSKEQKRLAALIRKIEILNLRQDTLFRILDALTKVQVEYLRTGDETLLKPISLRGLARNLKLAESTISRAFSKRSVQMPWARECPLSALAPGQRHVLREIMAKWKEEGLTESDSKLVTRFKREFGIRI